MNDRGERPAELTTRYSQDDMKRLASRNMVLDAGVAELADAQDLKSWAAKAACGFNSRPRHHKINELRRFCGFRHHTLRLAMG
jgi:hypothetical protein